MRLTHAHDFEGPIDLCIIYPYDFKDPLRHALTHVCIWMESLTHALAHAHDFQGPIDPCIDPCM